jgi:hypothetical protein
MLGGYGELASCTCNVYSVHPEPNPSVVILTVGIFPLHAELAVVQRSMLNNNAPRTVVGTPGQEIVRIKSYERSGVSGKRSVGISLDGGIRRV